MATESAVPAHPPSPTLSSSSSNDAYELLPALSYDPQSPSNPPPTSQDYPAQIAYWSTIPSTVDGMLGGYPQVSRADLQSSANFLAKLQPQMAVPAGGVRRGVDCGAGIGRITKGLLTKLLDVVDVVEPVKKFTDELLLASPELVAAGRIGEIFNQGLESWQPREDTYWIIWNQWCLNHLTDTDLIAYLSRCARALTPTGMIIVKENNASTFVIGTSSVAPDDDRNDIFDPEDCSVTRSDAKFRRLFAAAGLLVVRSELQKGFPERLKLYPVRMYALRPAPAPSQGSVE
ncbi:hypothetical protein DRE_06729 [Drechslerella stenobrocha 248]|uniref:Alpha N-terminal protein methyltransferase 1 n=1 Tax=Drechslerella stenobrocha 248 TaxID=1043628 RepID=W7HKD4_9PEZI|nr:hypothetical protein DRE_06729 [Drechslerella stenobrocha 248]